MSTMGERIKAEREALGLTQEELGAKIGVQKSNIAKYENGRIENIKRVTIAKMSILFGCDPAYLLCYTDERVQPTKDELFEALNDRGKERVTEYMRLLALDPVYKRTEE